MCSDSWDVDGVWRDFTAYVERGFGREAEDVFVLVLVRRGVVCDSNPFGAAIDEWWDDGHLSANLMLLD